MLCLVGTHLVRAVLVAAALLFAIHELPATIFAYFCDVRWCLGWSPSSLRPMSAPVLPVLERLVGITLGVALILVVAVLIAATDGGSPTAS